MFNLGSAWRLRCLYTNLYLSRNRYLQTYKKTEYSVDNWLWNKMSLASNYKWILVLIWSLACPFINRCHFNRFKFFYTSIHLENGEMLECLLIIHVLFTKNPSNINYRVLKSQLRHFLMLTSNMDLTYIM